MSGLQSAVGVVVLLGMGAWFYNDPEGFKSLFGDVLEQIALYLPHAIDYLTDLLASMIEAVGSVLKLENEGGE